MTMMLIAWCKTLDQLNVLSGLGGSFVLVSELPHWAMQGMPGRCARGSLRSSPW